MTIIKWIKLKNICEEMSGKTIHLHSSTDMPDDHIAGCEFTLQNADIILNMRHTKSEEMVIRSIAHELNHIIKGTKEHGSEFDMECIRIEERIKKEYFKK